MQAEQINTYAPNIDRDALIAIYGQEPEYYRKNDLQLKYTEDDGPWLPSNDVKDCVPNIEQIEVELIDETTDIDRLSDKFLNEVNIGLVLMGRKISRYVRPTIIVLTTSDTYYVIDPDDTEKGMNFLTVCLENPNLTLWTTSGLHEADCLFHNYNITLHKSSAKCCLGLHLHLMKVIAASPEEYGRASAPLYPTRAYTLSRRSKDIRLQSFESLVQIWLNIDDTRDIEFNHDQLNHLTRKPLNQTAINIIKKRCSLVLKLAASLEFFSNLELNVMNENVLNSLIKCNDAASARLRKLMRSNEKNKKASYVYLAHLDNSTS